MRCNGSWNLGSERSLSSSGSTLRNVGKVGVPCYSCIHIRVFDLWSMIHMWMLGEEDRTGETTERGADGRKSAAMRCSWLAARPQYLGIGSGPGTSGEGDGPAEGMGGSRP